MSYGNYGLGGVLLGIIAILRLVIQARTVKEAAAAKLAADAELSHIKRDIDERAARHLREAAERAEERQQKEALIAALQQASKDTLDVLKAQISAQQITAERAFATLDRNTHELASLSESVASLAQDSRSATMAIASIQGGSGCRAAH